MRVSVVINTYNRFASLQTTLKALRYQTHTDFEVIVVNGPSSDETESLRHLYDDGIVWRNCPVVNISVSRNMGINAANGEIVAFIDDDAIPEPDWLAKIAAPYCDPRVGGVGGIVWDHTGRTLQYKYSLCDRMGRTKFLTERPDFQSITKGSDCFVYLQGTNSSFRRSVLAEIGGFDEEIEYYHDETDVAARVNDLGYKLIPLPDGAVHHKYLASHLRTSTRTVLEPFPIVKNSYYFAQINGSNHYDQGEILEYLENYTNGVRKHGDSAIQDRRMSQEQYDYFQRRVEEGRCVGLQRGASGQRKLGCITAGNPSDFRCFPAIRPAGQRLVACFISSEYPPENFGGIGRFTKDLAEGMAELGHQIHVITKTDDCDRVDWENGVWLHRLRPEVERIKNPEMQEIPYKWNLLHCAGVYNEALRINELHPLQVISSPLWSSEGLLCSLDDQLPSVITLMTSQKTLSEIEPKFGKDPLWRQQIALEQHSVVNAKGVHAISNAILKKTLGDYAPGKRNAEVCYLGVRDESSRFLRSRADDDPTVNILYVGRLETRKGTDLLLSAAQRLCSEFSHVKFTLIGKDNSLDANATYQAQFSENSRPLIDSGRVQFCGALSDEELYAAYADADVMVLPSRFESFGLVLLEALAFGTPIAGARVGGIEEIIEDGVNGLLFDPESVDSLTNSLRQMISKKELRREMRSNARQSFLQKWDLRLAAHRTAELYQRFANDHQASQKGAPPLTDVDRRLNVAKRLNKLSISDPTLHPITQNAALQLLSDCQSLQLAHSVESIWYYPKKSFVAKLQKILLKTLPTPEKTKFYIDQLNRGVSRKDVTLHLLNSIEARTLQLPTEWVDKLPATESWEKIPFAMSVFCLTVGMPRLWHYDGPIRKELRRHRQRRLAKRNSKLAA